MNQQQLVQLLVIALAIGVSAIGWVIRKLSEQAAVKRAKEQVQRRREEVLRTGRGEAEGSISTMARDSEPRAGGEFQMSPGQPSLNQGSPTPPTGPIGMDEARRRFQELAQRRRAELEARRAQEARGGQARPSSAQAQPTGPIVVFGPGGMPTVQPGRPAAPRSGSPPSARPAPSGRTVGAPVPGSVATQRPVGQTPHQRAQAEARRRMIEERQARARAAFEQQERVDAAAQKIRSAQAAQVTARTEAATEATAAAARGSLGGALATALGRVAGASDVTGPGVRMHELRRAVVLGEVLGTPPGMRPPT